MTSYPLFCEDIDLYSNQDEGMRIECPEPYFNVLKNHLSSVNLRCGQYRIIINGTNNIHSRIEFTVSGQDFDLMINAVNSLLQSNKVTFVKESFMSQEEQHIRLNLTNVSAFNK